MYSVCYFVDLKKNRTGLTSENREYEISEKKFPFGVARSRANRHNDCRTDGPNEANSGFLQLLGEVTYKVHGYVVPGPNLFLRCSGSDGMSVC